MDRIVLCSSVRTLFVLAFVGLRPASALAQERATLRGHDGLIWSIAFSPDGKTLASAGNDKTIRLWDTESGSERDRLEGHTEGIRSIAFSPDGKLLASGAWDSGEVILWDMAPPKKLASLGKHVKGAMGVAFSPDGKRLAVASGDGLVKLWDVESRQELRTLEGHEGQVFAVAFAPNGQDIATAGSDRTLRVWNAETGRERYKTKVKSYAVFCLAYSPNGKRLASGGTGEGAYASLWSASDGEEIGTKKTGTHAVFDIKFSPNGKLLATANHAEMTATVWEAATGKEVKVFHGHKLAVMTVAFSPDGRLLASAGADKVIKIWDLPSGANAARASRNADERDDRSTRNRRPSASDDGEVGSMPRAPAAGSPVPVAKAGQEQDQSSGENDPESDAARNAAIRWLKANNKFGPDHQLVSDMTQQIDGDVRKGKSWSLIIGGGLTKSGNAYELCSWAGRFFAFKLSDDQAQKVGIKESSIDYQSGSDQHARRVEPVATLSGFQFADDPIQGANKITGKVHCQKQGEANQKYALRLAFSAGGSTRQLFYHLDSLPEDGDIDFSFNAINGDSNDKKHSGPTAFFIDLVTVKADGGNIDVAIYSNTLGKLADVNE